MGDEAVGQPGMGVQEEGAGSPQPQQKQQQLQLEAHVQEEGAGQEPQHAAVHRVLWGQAGQSRGMAYATGVGGVNTQELRLSLHCASPLGPLATLPE